MDVKVALPHYLSCGFGILSKELSYVPEETSAETSYNKVEQLREQLGRNRCPGEREELLIPPSFMALSTLPVY